MLRAEIHCTQHYYWHQLIARRIRRQHNENGTNARRSQPRRGDHQRYPRYVPQSSRAKPLATATGTLEDDDRHHWTESNSRDYTENNRNLTKDMTYREPLPDEAEEITSSRLIYRLVRNIPPIHDDFRSQRSEKPTAQFNISECRARGVSVFTNLNDAERQTRRRSLRNLILCLVILAAGAGRIEKTGGSSHYTWWPYDSYDILANCQLVKP